MYGFHGRMLFIDLTQCEARIVPTPALAAEVFGGKGLATHLMLEHIPAGADALGPENRLIFAAGPFCGTRIWGGSRYGVFTKSPLTGGYCESYSGGAAPESVDAAGYDAVIVSGTAAVPTVLRIHPEGCDFLEAEDIWGMESFAAEDAVKQRFTLEKSEYGKPAALVIGPAGERGVRFAVINNDYWRCAGRTGAGTVMGSKRLKAVLFQGDRKRPLADTEGVAAYSKAFAAAGKDNPGVKAYKKFGTTMMVALMNTAGAFPTRYWEAGECEHWEKISGETYHNEHDITAHACRKCFMACGRMATISKGRHTGLKLEGPEYETIYVFGGLCMIDDMAEIAYLNDLCDQLGMDTITAGNLCAFAIEAVKRGKLEYDIDYGQVDAIAGLLREIAARTGTGALLADGIVPAAKTLGLEDLAVHVKGLEPPGYDPRALKGMGLAYAVSCRGACHLRSTFYKPELAGMIAPDAIEGKAKLFTDFEDRLTLFDTFILCRFYRDLYSWEKLIELMPYVFGQELTKDDLRRIASRVTDMTREFNLREGLGPETDTLPQKLLTEALPSGKRITPQEIEQLVADYYAERGWDASGRLQY
ncbi:aldehyde ferredoxin oxidoreductase family protein [Desulfovibrio inopinatus]|uniref:aldehyde ferredoxin oxidoreductase family protein n=1 Tax=Desulfovibrio inopinatus TaxID=102109 RepID=UPI00040A1DC8|nr:aldehyde ferredoxin oxidoreductase family protein [Desulfovibrio inopinatus]